MSKSLGNAVGVHEPAVEMYGKVMSISDELMWRYWTSADGSARVGDCCDAGKVRDGSLHPMQAKKNLAWTIVADFHSAGAAAQAGEDWAKQFQKDEVPEEVEEIGGFGGANRRVSR